MKPTPVPEPEWLRRVHLGLNPRAWGGSPRPPVVVPRDTEPVTKARVAA